MTRFSGVFKILRFNWPWYVGALTISVVAIYSLRSTVEGTWGVVAAASLLVANFWLLGSLAVSHYIYDRSPISRGNWMDGVDPASVRRAAIFHAGQDEVSETVIRVLPSAKIQAFDFYDPVLNGTPSLERARALAKRRDVPMLPNNIPLNDSTLDLGLVVFAAHEIRQDRERVAFFRELARALAPTGLVLIVEHLRDGWNFLAYGPGAFHFLSRKTWRRCFAEGGLKILRETSCTRFVRIFVLGKTR